jgi:dihydroorotate dehydrogenase
MTAEFSISETMNQTLVHDTTRDDPRARSRLYDLLRPLIFRMQPETAHHVTLALLRMGGAVAPARWLMQEAYCPVVADRTVQAFGLTFPNAVGLAAGYDKDGLGWRGLAALGFGHIEVGTVTPRPQAGNPGPRVFRLVEDRAVINRMGFPNRGAEFVARRLGGKRPAGLILGVNIGKNLTTSLEHAGEDYLSLVKTFAPLADYLAINVSSPNTPGLRTLQTRSALEALLRPLDAERRMQSQLVGRHVPLLVKLAPDLTSDELDGALDAILAAGIDGVITSNTTLSRKGLTSALASESGGMSGAPARQRNTQIVRDVMHRTNGRLTVIASGGIMRPEDAQEKLDAGATLVQLYTGLIYEGPGLVKAILNR